MQNLTIGRLQQASLQVLQQPLNIGSETLAQGLNALLAIQQRQEIGGVAPESVLAMIDELNATLATFAVQARMWQQHGDDAENKLLQQAQ